MRLSDLQSKDIISTRDGKRIGRIIDVEVDSVEGKIIYFVVEPKHFLKKTLTSSKEAEVSYKEISKIGEDVILVDL